jgi:hypothetical protein
MGIINLIYTSRSSLDMSLWILLMFFSFTDLGGRELTQETIHLEVIGSYSYLKKASRSIN